MSGIIDYERMSVLGERIKLGIASGPEKAEYMQLLMEANMITPEQYRQYRENTANDTGNQLLKAALIIGAVALIGYVISDLLSDS